MSQLHAIPARGAIEWEARRVATAFGVTDYEKETHRNVFRGFNLGRLVSWGIHENTHLATNYKIDDFRSDGCYVSQSRRGTWRCVVAGSHNELMARGLYCLGFADESILSQLPPLSMHEKLELRLSMPREFWPEKWIDEEAKAVSS